MERSILKELNKATVEAYINREREAYLSRLFWNKFFPLKYTTQLTWESLSGSSGNPVMADVIEYNSSAPIKSRRVVTKTTGDIPKIAIKRQMDEKDMNDYNILKALASNTDRAALLDLVFNDIDFCYAGVQARTEFLAMQALSHGDIALTASNNNGIITEVNADFGIPTANKTAVSIVWSSASTATPIADITVKQNTANDAGYSLKYMVMDKATLRYFLAAQEVKDQWAVYQRLTTNRKSTVTLAQANEMLAAHMLPIIIVVDSSVRNETLAHVLSSVAPWKTGYVTFIPDMNIGNILHGPIAEENAESVSKKAIMVKRDHVLISKWSELEPFGEFTKGQANAFPRFTDVNGIYILQTNAITTWA
jgi:hypothetical protein